MPRKGVSGPPATAPTGWAKRLPTPVEVLAGKHKKVLRTLSDVRGYVNQLPQPIKESQPWRRVVGALGDAAEGRRHTAAVEISVRTARRAKPPDQPT